MKAIIPTAGVGSRLRPFTHTIPKVLLQVADKPILGHILDKLVQENVHDVTFVVGYLGDQIEEYVRKAYPNLTSRFVEQKETRGLGHAILLTREALADTQEPVLIILGDTVIDADLSLLKNANSIMLGVHEVEDPRRFGVVEVQGDQITAMVEKPERPVSNLAICGIYYLPQIEPLYTCLQDNMEGSILTKGELQLTDALQVLLRKGTTMKAFQVDGWFDCGKPETLLATNRTLLEQRFSDNVAELLERFPTVRIKPPVYIGPGAEVTNSIIGPDVTIGAGASVNTAIVSNAIINEGAQLNNVLLADSIIGNESQVQAAALRLYVGDRSEVIFD
jgi:glucose-1-phosphate thymidylyltransferase